MTICFTIWFPLLLLLLLHCFGRVRLCATPQTAARQAPLWLGFSRQEYWSGLPFPSPMHACMLSCFSRVQLCATPWTAVHLAPLSMGFSRQEYWSGLPPPSPRLPDLTHKYPIQYQSCKPPSSLLCWSFNGQEASGLESTLRKWKRERSWYPLVYAESQ